jgi:formate/nitrite transporter FocA (FNT family)
MAPFGTDGLVRISITGRSTTLLSLQYVLMVHGRIFFDIPRRDLTKVVIKVYVCNNIGCLSLSYKTYLTTLVNAANAQK